MLYEDADNPRTEFPEETLDELAADIRYRGVLQPLVVHPADSDGRYQVHFGAKRLRAAIRAALHEVPVIVRDLPADRYAQVAENQKRHGLCPLELARFIRAQVDAGDSNATIARQLGMNLTAVAHHLSLLDLPPVLDNALEAGRCTSPRTLHELSKLHADRPDQVHALLASEADITRASVVAIRSAAEKTPPAEPAVSAPDKLIAQASAACDRLERALSRIEPPDAAVTAAPELVALRSRVEAITTRWLQGSDRQTPAQATLNPRTVERRG
jgi:ParB family chromosome partitioning protein